MTPASAGLHLWGRMSSINVRKVVLCAQWLEISLPRTDAGMAFGLVDTAAYRALNPNGLVPLLQDGDFNLWESNTIVRYLCARQGKGYPADLPRRADAERWMDWQQTTLNRASGGAFVQWVRTPPERRDAKAIEASVRASEPLFTLLDAHLAQRSFMAGEAPTMADFPIACELHRWFGLPQPRPHWPHLERYFAHWLAQPCARGVLDLALE